MSNAHCSKSNPSSDQMVFEPSMIAMKSGVSKEIVIQAIPLAFKLYAKLCTIDAFRLAMLLDEETIEFIGQLTTRKQEDIKPDKEVMDNQALFFKKEGHSK